MARTPWTYEVIPARTVKRVTRVPGTKKVRVPQEILVTTELGVFVMQGATEEIGKIVVDAVNAARAEKAEAA